MNCLLWVLSTLQRIKNSIILCKGRCNRTYVLPFAQRDGFDMILLNSGIWITAHRFPAGPTIPEQHIKARFNAETHTIIKRDSAQRLERWHWLAVSTKEIDISEFFCNLRHSADLDLSNSDIMYLFANQKGWYPTGDMEITLRNGFIDHICIFNGVQRISSNSELNKHIAQINYIK